MKAKQTVTVENRCPLTPTERKTHILKNIEYEFVSKDGMLLHSKRYNFLPENRKIMLSLQKDIDFKGHLVIDDQTNEFFLRMERKL
jgi:hypothetical protein